MSASAGERGGFCVEASLVELTDRAQDAYIAADFQESYRLALEGLDGRPDDPDLLAIAGRAALELGLDEAVTYLGKLVELTSADASAWRDLGMARLNSSDPAGAEQALRTAVQLDPADPGTRVSLGHLAYLGGAVDEADRQLSEAARLSSADTTALRSLAEMRRLAGRMQGAIEAANELVRRAPDDVAGAINLAELNLLTGNYDEALTSYRRLSSLDKSTGHAGHIIHGMIEVEFCRERWRRALDHVIMATAVDRSRLTTDLLTFVTVQLFGTGKYPAPPRFELEGRLRARRVEHRRLHAELLDGWGI
jgi:tetratricopeptide (TPR) repeat protein